jgi:plastocyanin
VDTKEHNEMDIDTTNHVHPRPLSRRRLLLGAGGLGLATAGAVVLRPAVGAAPNRPGGSAAMLVHQDATPATPELGEQPDGTHLWRVKVGGMDMENLIDVQAFLPTEITINAGDAIWFEFDMMPGFHTVTLLSGEEPAPVFTPDPDAGTPAADEPPTLILSPEFAFAVGGDTYDGTGTINSGVDVLRDPAAPPFVVTFTEPGEYEYVCLTHGTFGEGIMTGQVTVQEADSDLPDDQAAYDQMAEEEYAAIVEEGLAAIEEYAEATVEERDDGTTLWELSAGAGEGKGRVFQFLPNEIEIQVGDTIRWVNRSGASGEPHTVTFISGEEPPEDVLIEPRPDGPPKLIQNNLTLLPQGGDVYSGEGYVNSGFIGEFLPGGSNEYELTFDTAGEFPYYCVLHGGADGEGMSATVTVTERE